MHTDVLIIGAGPAGSTAGLYIARAGFSCALFAGGTGGGQLMLTNQIDNFPGFGRISGIDLIEKMQQNAVAAGVALYRESIVKLSLEKRPFSFETTQGFSGTASCVIIATGSSAKWLQVPGEEEFIGKGISTCAICDGFFQKGKEVAVIGGGNSAVYMALYLSNIAKNIYLLFLQDKLTANTIEVNQLLGKDNVHLLPDAKVLSFQGKEKLQSITFLSGTQKKELSVSGAFVAIGYQPNVALVKDQLEMTETGFIATDCRTGKTSVEGVFACGDVQEEEYRQAITACGSGCVAALSAQDFLRHSVTR